MNLHRATSKPDWDNITQPNVWQKLASRSSGVLTPGNLVTMIGLGLVMYGLFQIVNQQYLIGGILLALGRLCDLVDGWLAEVTGTKSPLGEFLDAVIDKIGTLLTVIVLFIAVVAPWWVLGLLILPHVLITIVVWFAHTKNARVHPSRVGKMSMAAAWVGIIGLIVIKDLGQSDFNLLYLVTYLVVTCSVILGLVATLQYTKSILARS